ncbi:MAG TPA: dihydrodipicolinate synthase family protein [Woeseiaceae bacterium]|nr:dihydrodipicolinate synthase family protein [Woeseiaceae bacterium]
MNKDSVNWRGYIPAITTPFTAKGELDVPALRSLLEWLAEEGMHGLVVAGTTGEWFSLSREEKRTLFATVGEVLKGELPLIAGCNAFTADAALANAVTAARSGFDGILLTPPPYVRPCEREIVAFYEDVNRASPLPICIYNWPPGTNIDLSREILEQLAELDNVVAIKNSTGNEEHFLDVMHSLNGKLRIFGVAMNETGADLVESGKAHGTMGAGAVLGKIHPDFFNALWAGDREKALSSGALDQVVMSDWFNKDYTAKFGSAQAVFKAALNLQGLAGGFPRRPILPLGAGDVGKVRATLTRLGRL